MQTNKPKGVAILSIKDDLKQYRFKMRQVDLALEEYERFKTRAEKITAMLGGNPAHSNKVSDKVGDNATIMADIANKYQQRWLDAENERIALMDKLRCIDEPYRTILHMRYVQNRNFENIATFMGYSYKQILRLHGQAINLFGAEDLHK